MRKSAECLGAAVLWLAVVLSPFSVLAQSKVYVSPADQVAPPVPKDPLEVLKGKAPPSAAASPLPYISQSAKDTASATEPNTDRYARALASSTQQEAQRQAAALQAIDQASQLDPASITSNAGEPQNAGELLKIANARRANSITQILEARAKRAALSNLPRF